MKLSKKSAQALAEVNYDFFKPTVISTIIPYRVKEKTNIEDQIKPTLPSIIELYQMFDRINNEYFEGQLPQTKITYSTRMLIAGTFTPSKKEIRIGQKYHEIFPDDIEDTLKHEMIHIIHLNHDAAFKRLAAKIGASVKAKSHPSLRGKYKYLYYCPACGTEYARRKRLRMAYCGICCKGRRFDPRYKLKLKNSQS